MDIGFSKYYNNLLYEKYPDGTEAKIRDLKMLFLSYNKLSVSHRTRWLELYSDKIERILSLLLQIQCLLILKSLVEFLARSCFGFYFHS